MSYISQNKISTKVSLYQSDANDLDHTKLGQFDIIASDAVFEHCTDLKNVLNTTYNLLNKNGIMYAGYGGPFWHTWGGDHFSGRDKIDHGFNHLILDTDEYISYFKNNVRDLNYELHEGGGGVLVSLDLFSKLSGNEYIEFFKATGFKTKEIIVEFSSNAITALKSKDLRNKLIEKYPNFRIDDFILKTHLIILEKTD